jgi:hypothetical protein
VTMEEQGISKLVSLNLTRQSPRLSEHGTETAHGLEMV